MTLLNHIITIHLIYRESGLIDLYTKQKHFMNKRKRIRKRKEFFSFVIAWSCMVLFQPVPAQIYADQSYRTLSTPDKQKFPLDYDILLNNGKKNNNNPDDEEGIERSFLFKEVVFSVSYYFDRVPRLLSQDITKDQFELSLRPPGSYIGLDYVRTFSSESLLNKILPDWLPLTAMVLHPRIVYDSKQRSSGLDPIEFAPQDFWLRFNPFEKDRLLLRVGQFVIPYGANPILAPRQRFMLPIEATDLGLKWDWGIALKGPAGEYDWEIAATIGSGVALHSPHLFSRSDRESYLFSGRIGSPSYWDFQHGLSFLYGDLPVFMGPIVISDVAISHWRVGYDTFYKHGTYLKLGAQMTYGQDGIGGDEEFVMATNGKKADVLGSRAWIDWVIPKHQNLKLAFQFESVVRDLSTWWAYDTAVIFQIDYSLTTKITAVFDYREGLNPMGRENDAVYFTLIYYSR